MAAGRNVGKDKHDKHCCEGAGAVQRTTLMVPWGAVVLLSLLTCPTITSNFMELHRWTLPLIPHRLYGQVKKALQPVYKSSVFTSL
jgi:hypothetical protein